MANLDLDSKSSSALSHSAVTYTLAELAELLGLTLPAGLSDSQRIRGLNTLVDAGRDELSFLSSEQYARQLPHTRAAAVLLHRKIRLREDQHPPAGVALLVVDDAELAAARVLQKFAPPVPRPPIGVDPSARVAPSAKLGEGVRIGPHVIIGERATLGARCVLHAGVFIGDDTTIGEECEIFPSVVVRERITIGKRVTIHASSVLGTDGFGYRWDGKGHMKVPQIGTVVIEDDVEIGSCVCIDRAKFAETRIGRGTKIDNLVQIGHNVQVGPHCIIVGQAGIAGSVTLGVGVMLGGQSAVRDHIKMGDGAMLAACSGVMEDVPSKQVVSGLPAVPHRQSMREQAAIRDLPDLRIQLRKLQEQVDRLQKALEQQAAD